MTDAVFFHMVLLRTEMHINALAGSSESLELILHKMKVIQLVNAGLQNAANGISDCMIITIAFLAVSEVSA